MDKRISMMEGISLEVGRVQLRNSMREPLVCVDCRWIWIGNLENE